MTITTYYSTINDVWVLRVEGNPQRFTFDTQMEVMQMSRKLEFAQMVRTKVTDLDNLAAYMNELRDIYNASGYASGGSDPIADADLEALGMTAADLANFGALVENLNLFFNNGEPMQFDFAGAIDRFRSM